MKKTELMLEYEKETRETLDMSVLSGDATGSWYGYNCDDVGSKEPLIWIPPRFIDYDGNYGESRTIPDGWEEK